MLQVRWPGKILDVVLNILKQGNNLLFGGSNITHVDPNSVNKCFAMHLLFSCDVSGQYYVAGVRLKMDSPLEMDPAM